MDRLSSQQNISAMLLTPHRQCTRFQCGLYANHLAIILREVMKNVVDVLCNLRHTAFLRDELLGSVDKHETKRLDGFISPLVGLHCWDLVQKLRRENAKSPVDSAMVATQAIYPKNIRAVGESAIR